MCQQGKPLAKTFARTHFATVCHADFYKTQDLKGLLLWEGAQFWIFFVGATILSGVSGKGVQIKQKCFFCGRSWFWFIFALQWRFQNSAGTSDVLCWVLRSKLFPKTLKRKGQKDFAQCPFLINQTKRAHWEKIFFEGGGTYDYIKFKRTHSVTYEFRNRTERCTNKILESKPGNFYSTCQDWMASQISMESTNIKQYTASPDALNPCYRSGQHTPGWGIPKNHMTMAKENRYQVFWFWYAYFLFLFRFRKVTFFRPFDISVLLWSCPWTSATEIDFLWIQLSKWSRMQKFWMN